MGLLNIIRPMHLREKLSIREIARRTGLSRSIVSKHLAANTIEPKFATPERLSKLNPFSEKLAGWLKTEIGKPRKQRQKLKQIHADLVKFGFTGCYNRVAAFARDWRADRQREQQMTGRGTFVPLFFDPGKAFQFDWSDDFAILGGEHDPCFRWPTSSCRTAGPFLLRAYLARRPTRCCLTHTGRGSGFLVAYTCPGHLQQLGRAAMGPRRGRTKTAVDRVGRGKEREVNMRFLAMTNHYDLEPEFCNPAAGWDCASEAASFRACWRRGGSRKTCGIPVTSCFRECLTLQTSMR